MSLLHSCCCSVLADRAGAAPTCTHLRPSHPESSRDLLGAVGRRSRQQLILLQLARLLARGMPSMDEGRHEGEQRAAASPGRAHFARGLVGSSDQHVIVLLPDFFERWGE